MSEALEFIATALPALPIQDDGGFFSAAALEKGIAAIRDIRRRFHKDVLIETFPQLPADMAKGVDLNDKAARRKFFAAWAEGRQKAAGLDAISVLVCKAPMSLQVAVGPLSSAKFPAADRDKLVQRLVSRFSDKNYDGGLADALSFISETLDKNRLLDVKHENTTAHTGAGEDIGSSKEATTAGGQKKAELLPAVVAQNKETARRTPANPRKIRPRRSSKKKLVGSK